MIILVDTNVVLDVLMKREPYTEAAQHILTKCANREIVGYLAAHSIPNLFRSEEHTSELQSLS